MTESGSNFLNAWHMIMFVGTIICGVLAIAAYLFFQIQQHSRRDPKKRYDFISKHETRYLWLVHLFIAIGIGLYLNTTNQETMELSVGWFFVRLAVAICGGTLYGYIAFLILKYYYPYRLNRKLKKLRYKPRINTASGNKMKLLSEEEEDVYLDEGMQAEENVFSVDYDVWIDESTGDTKIEKYPGHLQAEECDRCGLQTLKLDFEEITKEATEYEEGELIKHFKCSYCNRIRRRTMTIARKGSQPEIPDKPVLIDDPLSKTDGLASVKIEIQDNKGITKTYEFSNIEQAKQFLKEFNITDMES